VSQSDKERAAEPKDAPRDRELSDTELETVAAAGDGGKGDPNDKPPPPPANSVNP
jgi:hypothetical protein